MFRKTMKAALCVLLSVTVCLLTCTSAFAANGSGKTYVSETVLSYGSTDDEAKKWLTDNGYEILDHNLNEGADDLISKKRAVYLGYKTTENVEEAITDMRLMNMKGGYSVQDYQLLLEEQKTQISVFIDSFIVAVNEYRTNYQNGAESAKAAHDMLNMFIDDDTQQKMGDLLLNKIKEEYTDEEYVALSDEERAQTADMTTILMQGNANAILSIEQTIAIATDSSDNLWIDRYAEAKTYDDMLDTLMEEKNLTVNQAEQELTVEYDDAAKSIASKLESYKDYLGAYTNEDITLGSTQEEQDAYKTAHPDFEPAIWFAAGTQYELLQAVENDDITLLDLLTGDDFDLSGEDRYLLYPLIASLTKGQRACLDFLSMYQIVALGINDGESYKTIIENAGSDVFGKVETSVYNGVDRAVFGNDVALTGEAYKLQNSSGKDAMSDWKDSISDTSYALYIAFGVSLGATALAWITRPILGALRKHWASKAFDMMTVAERHGISVGEQIASMADDAADLADDSMDIGKEYTRRAANVTRSIGSARAWQEILYWAGVAFTCITAVLTAVSIWSTYNDLKAFYKSEFTPIPAYMVDESTDENDEKVFTYYSAVKCNRIDAGFVTESTEILKDFGDLNGDVGRQWVALYTTKDKAAGNPVTADFKVQYENSTIPDDRTPLSMFCEDSAQNITDKRAGFTFADNKNGIYMFFGTDANAYAGSVITGGRYALIGGVAGFLTAAAFFAGNLTGKKRKIKVNEV